MPIPYLSHRQRVELAIPARLVFSMAVCNCFSDPDADEVKQLKDLLVKACIEPIVDLGPKEAPKLARRIDRICETAMDMVNGQSAIKVGMAFYYFLQDLLEREVLVLWEDSSFGQAMGILMPMFEHGFAQEKIDKSAQKQARHLLHFFQKEGYFA